jgi:ubiquinone biosynthesis protein Coq4
MKLSALTAKPQLIEVSLDDEAIIAEFGEAITFHTWDRQPMDVFMKLANATGNDTSSIINIVRTLILDEKGKEILKDDSMLPTHVLMKAIGKVTELLGK